MLGDVEKFVEKCSAHREHMSVAQSAVEKYNDITVGYEDLLCLFACDQKNLG